jgi:antitoxin CptB
MRFAQRGEKACVFLLFSTQGMAISPPMTEFEQGGSSENRRKRLLFRAQRRGFKEVDLIFGAYAEGHLAGLDEAGLDQFEALLTAPDQDVYAWLRGAAPVPAEYDNDVFAGLRNICAQQSPRWKN